MDIQKVKRSMRLSAIVVVISAGTIINITRNSHIRMVEFLAIFACGMAMGTLVVNLSLFIFLKKRNQKTNDSL